MPPTEVHRTSVSRTGWAFISAQPQNKKRPQGAFAVLAERVGFEPTIPETGMPDFESGAFDHSATSPLRGSRVSIAKPSIIGCFEGYLAAHHRLLRYRLIKTKSYETFVMQSVRIAAHAGDRGAEVQVWHVAEALKWRFAAGAHICVIAWSLLANTLNANQKNRRNCQILCLGR